MENALDYGKKINVTFSDFDKYIIDAIEILKELKKTGITLKGTTEIMLNDTKNKK